MILPIRFYNDPILRKKAEKIVEITPEIRKLAADMIETCLGVHGLGIAGPQVGSSLRIFIFNPQEKKNNKSKEGFPLVVINPKLSSFSEKKNFHSEGCLSIPGIYGDVLRPNSIHLEGSDLEGNLISLHLKEMDARIAMHENDHLNGVLFIDRMDRKERREIEPFLKRLEKNSKRK